MSRGTTAGHTISGTGFEQGATVSFSNGSGPTPVATNVEFVSSTELNVTITVKNGGPGRNRVWDVVVSSGGSSATLSNGLTITP